jgi:hypothetical protein
MKYLKHVAALAVTVVALMAGAVPAMGAPAPGFEEFANCPDRSVNPLMLQCIASDIDGGHLRLGDLNMPITDPIEFDGGRTVTGQFIVGSFDGGSQPIDGGLVGATGMAWLQYVFPPELLALNGDIELAGNPTSPLGSPVTLPIKVRLENPLLADTCYVGSDTNPITLSLAITNPGTTFPQGAILRTVDRTIADTTFAAPAASGCDLLLPEYGFVDALINYRAELPSPSGSNEAVFTLDGAQAGVQSVYPPFGTEL